MEGLPLKGSCCEQESSCSAALFAFSELDSGGTKISFLAGSESESLATNDEDGALPIPELIALADIASLVGELTMRLRWDTVGKKPKELLEKFAVPLRRKTLIFFDRGSPPLGTIVFLSD